MSCPLCRNNKINPFFEDKCRRYLQCFHCRLVFVPEQYWLSKAEEKSIYDLHENDRQDPAYHRFLTRLTTPLLKKLEAGKTGLDFGCGPGPALSAMLEEYGHQVDLFDLHYNNNPEVFARKYDFICATEVVEHLHEPNKELTRLFAILKQNGWLGIMTKRVSDQQAFSKWHYIRDLTHVCFYSLSTFEYLAQRFNAELSIIKNDVVLFQKIGPPKFSLKNG